MNPLGILHGTEGLPSFKTAKGGDSPLPFWASRRQPQHLGFQYGERLAVETPLTLAITLRPLFDAVHPLAGDDDAGLARANPDADFEVVDDRALARSLLVGDAEGQGGVELRHSLAPLECCLGNLHGTMGLTIEEDKWRGYIPSI